MESSRDDSLAGAIREEFVQRHRNDVPATGQQARCFFGGSIGQRIPSLRLRLRPALPRASAIPPPTDSNARTVTCRPRLPCPPRPLPPPARLRNAMPIDEPQQRRTADEAANAHIARRNQRAAVAVSSPTQLTAARSGSPAAADALCDGWLCEAEACDELTAMRRRNDCCNRTRAIPASFQALRCVVCTRSRSESRTVLCRPHSDLAHANSSQIAHRARPATPLLVHAAPLPPLLLQLHPAADSRHARCSCPLAAGSLLRHAQLLRGAGSGAVSDAESSEESVLQTQSGMVRWLAVAASAEQR